MDGARRSGFASDTRYRGGTNSTAYRGSTNSTAYRGSTNSTAYRGSRACMETPFAMCSEHAFRAQVRRERDRVDRHGGEFALVIIDLQGVEAKGTDGGDLTLRLRRIMRSIDLLGWLDRSRMGVLLPATGLQGAMTFAAHVRSGFRKGARVPPLGVFSYPDYWKEVGEPRDGNAGAQGAAGAWTPDQFAALFLEPIPWWKRATDVAGALVGLLVLSPLFLVLALYISSVSPGSVLFRQMRVGRGGRIFPFLKFRTMHEKAGSDEHRAHLQALIRSEAPMAKLDERHDTRIIPGGRFLRSTSLDELPQLVNVLRGEMSLVGPRPSIPYEAREFAPWHTRRFDALPGMTGLWQVSGKNRLSFEQMVRLDIAYARRASVLLDGAILARTVPTVVGLAVGAVADHRRRAAARAAGAHATHLAERTLGHV